MSGQNVFYDISVHVGEAEVAAAVAVGELFVIEAQEVEHGGVEVVNMNPVLDGLEAKVVGSAVNVAAFHATAGHPGGEAVVVVIPSIDLAGVASGFGHFHHWGASEFATPKYEGFIEHAALLEIDE